MLVDRRYMLLLLLSDGISIDQYTLIPVYIVPILSVSHIHVHYIPIVWGGGKIEAHIFGPW